MANITLASLLTLNNSGELKELHDLVIGILVDSEAFENVTEGWKVSQSIVESLRRGESASFSRNWNQASSSTKTSSLNRSVFVTSHVLGTISQSNKNFLLPLIEHLMSSRNYHKLYSTLLVERHFFLIPLYVGVGVSCLLVPTLALHKVPNYGLQCPTSFGRVG
jgi:hypothetical protein